MAGLREHIPPSICPLGPSAVAFLQLTNAARSTPSAWRPLTVRKPTVISTEFQQTMRDIKQCAPREVILRPWQSAEDKVIHFNDQTLHSMVIQPTLCQVLHVFQTWLRATAGNHNRSSSPMAYRLRRLSPTVSVKRPATYMDSKK